MRLLRPFLIQDETFDDTISIRLAAFLRARRELVFDLVARANRLALSLQARSPNFTVCHSDIHAGNLLIDVADNLYLVDWDDPILAPKERDLMFIGGGLLDTGFTPGEEETLFYRAYGQTQIDPLALAYYRYERIIQDVALFCEQIFSETGSREDREQSFIYLSSNFLPNNTIEIAYNSDTTQ